MKNNHNHKKLASEWFVKAQDDEMSAKDILNDKEGAASTVCFLSQQLAEKCLKGYLVYAGVNTPKIHQLDRLVRLCEKFDKNCKLIRKEAEYLTVFYIATRYPGDYPIFTFKDAEKALKQAMKIKNFIINKVI